MGIDPRLADAPPALLLSPPVDIPARHDAPEPEIYIFHQPKEKIIRSEVRTLDGLNSIIHMVPAAKNQVSQRNIRGETLAQRYILLFSSSNIRS